MIRKISPHLVRVFLCIMESDHWLTARQIAKGANVSDSVARHKACDLFRLGILERSYDLFPENQYRLADGYEKHELTKKILKALEIIEL